MGAAADPPRGIPSRVGMWIVFFQADGYHETVSELGYVESIVTKGDPDEKVCIGVACYRACRNLGWLWVCDRFGSHRDG